jgi:hypothetical protein
MLSELRALLVPAETSAHVQLLGAQLLELLPQYVHHSQVDLWALSRGLFLHCALEAVFGRRFVDALAAGHLSSRGARGRHGTSDAPAGTPPSAAAGPGSKGEAAPPWAWAELGGRERPPHPPAEVQRFAATFYAFEEAFELAASPLPHALLPGFTAARAELLAVLRAADGAGVLAGSPAAQLLERCADAVGRGGPLSWRPPPAQHSTAQPP